MSQKVVAKFGGSSVRNAQALQKVAQIIMDQKPAIAVISATYNTTNELEIIARASAENTPVFDELLHSLFARHEQMASDLSILQVSRQFLSDLIAEARELRFDVQEKGELSSEFMDHFYSLGERISSFMLSEYLKTLNVANKLFDARNFIKTDSDFNRATPIPEQIFQACGELRAEQGLVITQGFIGSDENGKTTTLGREGSDYSAALIAEAVDANRVDIWTDVTGVATFDPRVCDKAHFLQTMSYRQAELLASNGAKVLFPRTLAPVKRKGIPLYVKSTFAPEQSGTCIGEENLPIVGALAMAVMETTLTIVGQLSEDIRQLLNLKVLKEENDHIQFDLSEKISDEELKKIHRLLFEH